MCGIIGSIFRKGGSPPAPDLSCLAHRGPDAEGLVEIGNVRLGHTRLSIIDLAAGAQPMADLQDLAVVTYNGEIYNHQELRTELAAAGHSFATRSDTEVILAVYLAWGIAGFARLRGMYAFALHDRRDRKTILVRDPFGIKPLFWTEDKSGIHFASEQEALLNLCEKVPGVDMTSVLELLQHRYVMGEATLYKGVSRLEQGMALIVSADAESLHFQRFSNLVDQVENHRDGANYDLADHVRQRMADSVRHHMVSDVPIGVFLSGGLDSSVVAHCAGQLNGAGLNAFSIGFEGAETEASELPYARAVAARVGMDHHEVLVCADDFVALAPALSGTLNGPFADPADIAMLKLSRTASEFVKVVLSGEGSDEALAGYPKYAVDGYSRTFGGVMRLADRGLGRRGKIGIAADALAERDPVLRWMRWFQNDASPQGLLQGLIDQGADTDRAASWVRERVNSYPESWSNIQRMQVLDLQSWLPNNLLHRGDFTTMRASIEQRVPFLDIGITPWAVALSDRQKIKGFRGKMPLRAAYARNLPPEVLKRKKSGFRLPLGEWLQSDTQLRALAHDHLLNSNGHLAGWFGRRELEALLAPTGTTGGAKLIWTALSLELWLAKLGSTPAKSADARPATIAPTQDHGRLKPPSSTPVKVALLIPNGVEGRGGIERLALYLTRHFANAPGRIRLMPVLSRYSQSAVLKHFVTPPALLKFGWNCARGNYDIVHINVAPKGSTWRKMVFDRIARHYDVPRVIHLHGSGYDEFYQRQGPRSRRAIRNFFQGADAVAVLGQHWLEFVRDELQVDPNIIHVIANGVPEPTPSRKVARSAPLIVSLGLVGMRKGTDILLQALAKLPQDLSWSAAIGGNGEVARYRAMAASLGLADKVRFLGWIDEAGMNQVLSEASMFVLPSRAENQPVSILEAMARGLPVVATDVGAIPEQVIDGKTGILVSPGNAEELAGAIERLIRSPESARQLGESGRERFEAFFSISACAGKFASLYENLHDRRRP